MITSVYFEPMNIDPTIFFRGSEAEQEQAEQREAEAVEKWKAIIKSPNFRALQFTEHIKRTSGAIYERVEILHHSPRNEGYIYQLSYIGNGTPTMHENYINPNNDNYNTNENALYRHLLSYHSRSKGATITVLTGN